MIIVGLKLLNITAYISGTLVNYIQQFAQLLYKSQIGWKRIKASVSQN